MRAWGVSLWFVVCSWSVSGQPLTREQLTGTWIGVHTEVGPGAYCPLPTYLDLQPDGIYRLGLVDGSVQARLASWSVTADTLRLGSIAYATDLIRLQTDTLRIGTVFPMTFRRFRDVPVDSATVRQQLANRIWQSDSLTVHLHENNRVCLENRHTGQRTVHHWRLTRFGQSVFILMQGSQHTTGGQYKPLWQVVSTPGDQFRVTGWDGQRVSTEAFRLVRALAAGDSCQPGGFQVCGNCFLQQSAYYVTSFLSVAQRYAVQQSVYQHYQPLDQPGESGLIRVRFLLNCAGQMGFFTLQELDTNYCARSFDRRITRQLTVISQQQLPGLLTDNSVDPAGRFDKVITLNFRLKDGHLTDVFP